MKPPLTRSWRRLAVTTVLAVAAPIATAGVASAHPGNGNSGSSNGNSSSSNGNASSHQTQAQNGSPTSPQPASNADFSGNGANTSGPYNSTRNGSPSMNGSGNGNATGKPCAGCVGKADNKNPQGQFPNGSDNNAGYECDRNHGIGQTNPAHTGCTAVPPPVPIPVPPPVPPGPPGVPPGPPGAHVTLTSALLGSPLIRSLEAVSPAVRSLISNIAPSATKPVSPALAFTGSGIVVLLIAGLGFLLTGEGLRRVARIRVARRYDPAAAS